MTSPTIFSMTPRQVDMVMISGCIVGLYLVGLGIGEEIQMNGSIARITLYLIIAIALSTFVLSRTLANMVVKQ